MFGASLAIIIIIVNCQLLKLLSLSFMTLLLSIIVNVKMIKVNCESLSVFGASLANGGTCPTTGEEVSHHHHNVDHHHRNDVLVLVLDIYWQRGHDHHYHRNNHHTIDYHRNPHHDHPDFGSKSCSRRAQPHALLWHVQLQWTVCFQSHQQMIMMLIMMVMMMTMMIMMMIKIMMMMMMMMTMTKMMIKLLEERESSAS